jgi:tetratricopeptide (TPR) repeat protein
MGPLALFFVDAALSHRETAEAHYLKAGILWDLADYLAQAQPGDLKSRQQVVQELIDEYKSALKLGLAPAEARLARFDLGGILFKEGKLELAASQYRAILATDPISYEAHSNLGAVYLQMGRWEEALAEYQQALKIDPKDPQAHFKRGLILSQQTQFREAIDAYERALTLAPNYLEAHFNLALAYELSGEPEKAIPHYQHFLKLAPQDAEHTARRNSVEARIRTFETRDRRIR